MIINFINNKLIVQCIRKPVRKTHTPVVQIANTCSIGYPHDGHAGNPLIGTTVVQISGVIGTTVVRIASAQIYIEKLSNSETET